MRMATSSSTLRGRQSGADLKPPQAAVVSGMAHRLCDAAWTSAVGLGCAKTKSDLVLMPSGRQVFAFFCSAPDHRPQNSGCSHTAQRFHTAWVISRIGPECLYVSFRRQQRTCPPIEAMGGKCHVWTAPAVQGKR